MLVDPSRIDIIYSNFLLAQFKVKAFFPILIDLLSLPSEICDFIFNDSLTEGMGRLLASVYNGDIGLLQQLIENQEANEYARGQALKTLVILVFNGQLSREFVMDYFRQLMTEKCSETDYYFNAEIVCCCNDLYPEEVHAEIKRLYEDRLLEPYMIGWEEISHTLKGSKEELLQAKRQKPQFHTRYDRGIAELGLFPAGVF